MIIKEFYQTILNLFKNIKIIHDDGEANPVPVNGETSIVPTIYATEDKIQAMSTVKLTLPLINLYSLSYHPGIKASYHVTLRAMFMHEIYQMLEQVLLKFTPTCKFDGWEAELTGLYNNLDDLPESNTYKVIMYSGTITLKKDPVREYMEIYDRDGKNNILFVPDIKIHNTPDDEISNRVTVSFKNQIGINGLWDWMNQIYQFDAPKEVIVPLPDWRKIVILDPNREYSWLLKDAWPSQMSYIPDNRVEITLRYAKSSKANAKGLPYLG